ncbi:MAG TPA: SCO family protein [Methylomirabilota bacterium]|nr:SCO family protein [Methylomirabilota bacterium]
MARLFACVACFLVLSLTPPLPVPTTRAQQEGASGAVERAASSRLKAADFVLVDQDNQRFASSSLRGKVVVLNFIYTTCTDVCPIFTANMAQLQRSLNERHGAEIFFISVTTDPEVDSPKVLKAYARRYRADFKNWAFLTGSPAQLEPVWKSFGIRVIRKGRGLVQHTSLTTVIDRDGVRRFDHHGAQWRVTEVEKNVLSLLERKSR